MMVPDGCGPATYTLARECKKLLGEEVLHLDEMLVGSVHTWATDSRVTDSASAATAYASGIKTYNAAIGVDDDRLPVGNLFEAAKRQRNMLVGSVVTSRITHATPAAYSSHVLDRNAEQDIAEQQAGENLDFMIGGGRREYISRSDGRNLINELENRGVPVFTDRTGFDAWAESSTPFPAYGLLADSHMAYEIDKEWLPEGQEEPTLKEMTDALLQHLTPYADGSVGQGFMVMIEGSRIDHAGHANDLATHAKEAMMFDDAVGSVKAFAERHPNVLVVSVADHETGGMSLGKDGIYEWLCETVLPVSGSAEQIRAQLKALPTPTEGSVGTLFNSLAGFAPTGAELTQLTQLTVSGSNSALESYVGLLVADISGVGWTGGGHSAVDSNIYAMGPAETVQTFVGGYESNDVAHLIERFLDLDLQQVTDELRNNLKDEDFKAAKEAKLTAVPRGHDHHD